MQFVIDSFAKDPCGISCRTWSVRGVVFLFGSIVFSIASPGSAAAQERGQIVVNVVSLPSNSGQVLAALFASPEQFPTGRFDYEGRGQIFDGSGRVVFRDIPFGKYAVTAGHDENGNGDIDFLLFIPIEPHGVLNYEPPIRRFPNFETASIVLDRTNPVAEVTIPVSRRPN